MINKEAYQTLMTELLPKGVTLVAVSKTKPVSDIMELYELGHRDFGENYVQELVEKQAQLPQDIRWHFIGHLQSNKVKYIAPFVYLVHSIDNQKLLKEVSKQAIKQSRTIDCLLQIHIAEEETKFGLDAEDLQKVMNEIKEGSTFQNIRIKGLMGMASNTKSKEKVSAEFRYLKDLYNELFSSSTITHQLSTLSMGMSGDYKLAIEEGSNMIRIGSMLFGERNYSK